MIDRLSWLGHAGFALDLPPLVVIDPYEIPKNWSRKADIVLVTHEHHDHLSTDDIAKVAGPKTVFVAPADCAGKLPGEVRSVAPGQSVTVAGVEIEAVPAYNTNKRFHPKANGWVGYLVRHGGTTLYHAGDTDLIPEMDGIWCDVALLPVSGTYVMTAEEAARALARIRPKIAVPMHYGRVAGGPPDAERFRSLTPPGVEVRVLVPVPVR